LFLKLKTEYKEFLSDESDDDNQTVVTIHDTISYNISLRPKRPALVMSSTSWTEDEDFDILFKALELYDNSASSSGKWPHILCVVTGKGPLKEYYQQKVLTQNFQSVKVVFPWLASQDYPKMVASADLGICLHKSSSNLDLPMKVVDMFGCSLPVCAFNYDCIDELVLHEENGLLFKTSEELAQQLMDIFENFPKENKRLNAFRTHLKQNFTKYRWNECWNENALQVFS